MRLCCLAMEKRMNVVALIPARSGSKGVIDKKILSN